MTLPNLTVPCHVCARLHPVGAPCMNWRCPVSPSWTPVRSSVEAPPSVLRLLAWDKRLRSVECLQAASDAKRKAERHRQRLARRMNRR